MVTFVFDASTALRFLDNEAGADRVEEIFVDRRSGKCLTIISSVNWGEVMGQLAKRIGEAAAESLLHRLVGLGLVVVDVDEGRATRAALIKVKHKIPYADAFGVELATDSTNHILITADFDVKPAEHDIKIEFLPIKPKLTP